MLLRVIILLVALYSSACAPMLDSMQQGVQSRVQQMLGRSFGEKLLAGVDWVIDSLAKEGGFLDDPLVRIVMPPPLGLIVDVTRDLRADPKAALLETLMNRAAENAIPVAGPILKDLVTNMDQSTLTDLVTAPKQAATSYLMERSGPMIRQAVLPGVTRHLQDSGAIELYGELLEAHNKADVAAAGVERATGEVAVVESVAPEELSNYVAEQAVGGLFRKMAVKELSIRGELERKMELPF